VSEQSQGENLEKTNEKFMDRDELQTTAHEYIDAGLCVLPASGAEKYPIGISWTNYSDKGISKDEFNGLLSQHSSSNGLCIITGKVSGYLEVIDFDNHDDAANERYERFKSSIDSALWSKLVIEQSQSGGYHIYYKAENIGPNRPLAKLKIEDPHLLQRLIDKKTSQNPDFNQKKFDGVITTIETRAQGGLIVCDPTPGYSVVHGCLSTIPFISDDERTNLIRAARLLNEYVEKSEIITGIANRRSNVADEFNQEYEIKALLEKHGWKLSHKDNYGVEHWIRPGKSAGTSATFNYRNNLFYVFSSNAHPFQENKYYSKFAIYALLERKGKFNDTEEQLKSEGYGDQTGIIKIKRYLNNRYEFYYDVISRKYHVKREAESGYREMTDRMINQIFVEITELGLKIGKQKLEAVLFSEFIQEVDRIKEFYKKHAPVDSAGVDYIQQIADTIILKNEDEDRGLFNDLFRKWLVGIVGQGLMEFRNENVLIFSGDQAVGKTTWFNKIIPEQIREYTAKGMPDYRDKDSRIKMAENILINMDELYAMKRVEISELKSILSLEEIRDRPAYGRLTETFPRRASFCGSINSDAFLTDETGNRRFWVFEVAEAEFTKLNDGLVANAHIQAYGLWKSGCRCYLTKEENDKLNERNIRYTLGSREEELLFEYFSPADESDDTAKWIKISDIITVLEKDGHKLSTNSHSMIGKALKKQGVVSKRTKSARSYFLQQIKFCID
jgi:hypothetical protein